MKRSIPQTSPSNLKVFIACLLSLLLLMAPLSSVSAAIKMAAPHAPVTAHPISQPANAPAHTASAPVPAPLPAAGPLTATKQDALTTDVDSDGKADPGVDVITYTVNVTNTGNSDATAVNFSDNIDPNTTLVVGSLNASPLAANDSYTAIGNTLLEVGPVTTPSNSPKTTATGSVFDNDHDFLGDTYTLKAVQAVNFTSGDTTATSAQGGTITFEPDGNFSYLPAAGFSGTDTFTYTIKDDGADNVAGNADDLTGVGTVTITVNTPKVWYVDNTYTGANGASDGRSTRPFQTLAPLNVTATDPDGTGDIIYVATGGANYTGGITLETNEQLIGGGVALVVNSTTLKAAGSSPIITNVGGTAIALASGNTLTGFNVGDSSIDISGTSFGTLTVSSVALGGTGRPLSLTTGVLAAAFTSITSTSSSGGAGINIAGATGSMTVTGGTSITGLAQQCILVGTTTANIDFGNTSCSGGTDGVSLQNNSGGTRTFGTLGVSGGTGSAFLHGAGGGNVTVAGAANLASASNPIDIQNAANGTAISFAATTVSKTTAGGAGLNWGGTNTGATLGFASLGLTTSNGPGLVAAGGGTINVTTGTISATGSAGQAAPAISANGVTFGATFTSVSSTTSSNSGNGISLTGVLGTLTMNGGSISGAAGDAFLVSGGTANITYNGTISTSTARPVNVASKTGGTVAFGGAVSSTSNGVSLTTNTGATINFTGGLSLSTGANAAFTATGGGTVSATQDNTTIVNTLTTTTGTALNVANTTIGASGLTFRSITVTGNNTNPSSGIILNTTGANAGLKVTGNGGSCTPAIPTCNGGEIQGTTSHGVSLTSTKNVEFNLMSIHNTGDNGINGNGVDGFILRDSRIFNFGNAVSAGGATEDGMNMTNLSGTATIQRDNIGPDGHFTLTPFPTAPENDGITVRNTNVAPLVMNVTGTKFLQISNDGIDAEVTGGTATLTGTLNVDGTTADGTNTFDQINGRGVVFSAPTDNASLRTLELTIKNNTFNLNGIAGRWFAAARTTMNARFNNNTLTSTTNDSIRSESDPTIPSGLPLAQRAIVNATVSGNNMGGGSIFISNHREAIQNISFLNNSNIGGTAAGVGGAGSTGVHTGINLRSDRGSTLNVDMTGNTATADGSLAFAQSALYAQVTNNGGGNSTICVKLGGAGALKNTFTESPDTAGQAAVVLDTGGGGGGTIALEGWNGVGGPTGAQNFVIANNTINASNKALSDDPGVIAGGDCVTVLLVNNDFEQNQRNNLAQTDQVLQPANQESIKPFTSIATVFVPSNGNFNTHSDNQAAKKATQPVSPDINTLPLLKSANKPFASDSIVKQTTDSASTSSKSTTRSTAHRKASAVMLPSGENVAVSIGTLPPSKTVTIKFAVTVVDPFNGPGTTVSNQGSVSSSNTSTVLTDDPDTGTANDPTLTPVDAIQITINDLSIAEGAVGFRSANFKVNLSGPAGPSGVSVHYQTANNTAIAPGDYTSIPDTVLTIPSGSSFGTITVQVKGDTTFEGNETFFVNLSTAVGGILQDSQAIGTINDDEPQGADFDGDGRADVSSWGADTFWRSINSSGSPFTPLSWGNASGPTNDIGVPGDYDGDNKTDEAVWRPSDGNWFIWRSSTGTPITLNWGSGTDRPAAADYDGDGKTDLAVFRPSEGNWYIKRSSNGTTSTTNWGTSTDKLVAADYDGDGKADIAIWRPSEGNWYIIQSGGGGILIKQWGVSTDLPQPGDYDGDGKADLAVFRPSEGNWYIRNSSDNTTLVRGWGAVTDLPVPADYDGDGRVDIAVYRPSEGNWYIIRSSDATVAVVNLGSAAADKPVPNLYLGH